MKRRIRLAALAAGLLAAGAAFAEERRVEDLVTAIRGGEVIDASVLYMTAVHEDGSPERLLQQLAEGAADAAPAMRAALEYLQAQVRWQLGDIEAALANIDAAIAADEQGEGETPIAMLHDRARLLDALNRREPAREAYEAVLAAGPDAERLAAVRLRLGLMDLDASSDDVTALAEFAAAQPDTALRNRSAIVLALLGRPAEAIDLFELNGEGTARFRQEIRVAEWALRADDPERAQQAAWAAVRAAEMRRDRFYGIAVLIEAHRADDSLDSLVARWADHPEGLSDAERRAWIDLLRELERYEEAIDLFAARSDEFGIDDRRELLEMYREAGREEEMRAAYRRLIESEPDELAWRSGLARVLLERGEGEEAAALWQALLDSGPGADDLLQAIGALSGIGLDELAIAAGEQCVAGGEKAGRALLTLYGMHVARGRMDEARAVLERIDGRAAADDVIRFELAEAFEAIGDQRRAVDVIEALREARGVEQFAEDLEMRLAWLYSEIGDEDTALERWRGLWTRVNSVPRRRYVEDRMMTVASRLGTLADVAIELEERLLDGSATERDAGLLVRLYIRVGDSVSASEVVDEFMKASGGSEIDALEEKARVYVECNDYYNYERTVRRLMEVDPEGEGEYLRQLAMSQLERGRPDEAREVLARLAEIEVDTIGAEFEAGVLALAGMRDEAIIAYRRGLARYPDRIESYLLQANLMKELGQGQRAIGMFQYLAETAERDDLFTIAIDGLLNMEAPGPILSWARRITLERLAGRENRNYLYQLLHDLAEQENERDAMMIAIENSLPIAGDRRPSVLRELMDLAAGPQDPFGRGGGGDTDRQLAYGRRLIGLSEVVPPQVYLDLGKAFLDARDVRSAARTFGLARDLPDEVAYERQVASQFEEAKFREQALQTYERLLLTNPSDVALMIKVAQLHEEVGRDAVASGMYQRAIELLVSRTPVTMERSDSGGGNVFWQPRNLDDYDRYGAHLQRGLIVTLETAEKAASIVADQRVLLQDDLAELATARQAVSEDAATVADGEPAPLSLLAQAPRIERRAEVIRRLALGFGDAEAADAVDARLLSAFPDDPGLLRSLVELRSDWGLFASARTLIDGSGREDDVKRAARFLVGGAVDADPRDLVPRAETGRLFLPLLVAGADDDVRTLLRRTDTRKPADPAGGAPPNPFIFGEGLGVMGELFAAARHLGDQSLSLDLARRWLLELVQGEQPYLVEQVLPKCLAALNAENRRSLCQYVVGRVLEEPEKAGTFVTLLPDLQAEFEEPLATEEQILALLEEYGESGWAWGLGPVIALLPEEQRAGAVRVVWEKIPNTRRTMFLMQLVSELPVPAGEGLSQFVIDAVPGTLGDADDFIHYYVAQLSDSKFNSALGAEMAAAYCEHNADDPVGRATLADLLRKSGRMEEALEIAAEVVAAIADPAGGPRKIHAQGLLYQHFLPDHLDALVAAFDAAEEEQGPSVELTNHRLTLLLRAQAQQEYRDAVVAAVAQHPDDKGLRGRLRAVYSRDGQWREALAVLEAMQEKEPDDAGLGRQLVAAWRRAEHPARALEIRQSLDDDDAADANAGGGVVGMRVISGGVMMAIGPNGMPVEDRPTIDTVRDKVDEEDFEGARAALRRIWRVFPREDQGPFAFLYTPVTPAANLRWPDDEADEPTSPADELEQEQEQRRRRRGGLDAFREEVEEGEEPTGAWDVLVDYEFGRMEIDRLLRSRSPSELNRLQAVLTAAARTRDLEDLMTRAEAGNAQRGELMMLLLALDDAPEAAGGNIGDLLDDLVRAVPPNDARQLVRVASLYANTGQVDKAIRLFRWCATQSDAGGDFFYAPATTPMSASQLVEEVLDTIEDEESRIEIVERILEFADPGETWWGSREFYEQLVLDTWESMLDAEAALERCRPTIAALSDFESGVRRDAAKKGALMLARAGEFDAALDVLEIGLCRIDPEDLPERYRWWVERSSSLNNADLRALLPRDVEGWSDAPSWFAAMSGRIVEWVRGDRLDVQAAISPLALAALRMHESGESERAQQMLDELWALDRDLDVPNRQRLWMIDVARRIGDEERAQQLERALFDEGALPVVRYADVVRASDDPIALAEVMLESTRDVDLLNALIELDDNDERINGYESMREEADAARATLKAMDEAEAARKKAEAAG